MGNSLMLYLKNGEINANCVHLLTDFGCGLDAWKVVPGGVGL